jgi:hypothetical protein
MLDVRESMKWVLIFSTILGGIAALWFFKDKLFPKNTNIKVELRSQRLAIYNRVKDFLVFCSKYRTLQSLNKVNGTHDLLVEIDKLKNEIDQLGPLSMPEVEMNIGTILNNARQLQRILDRLAGPNPKPIDPNYSSAEDNRDGLIDWFISEEKEIRKLFESYLKVI